MAAHQLGWSSAGIPVFAVEPAGHDSQPHDVDRKESDECGSVNLEVVEPFVSWLASWFRWMRMVFRWSNLASGLKKNALPVQGPWRRAQPRDVTNPTRRRRR